MIGNALRRGSLVTKSGVAVLLFVILGSTSFPHHASAFLPVIDPTNVVQNTFTAGATTGLTTKELTLDPLAYAVAKVALQSITKSTVNWINSGFSGSPAFITDLDTTLRRVSDTYAKNFLGQLASNSSIKSPFQDALSAAIKTRYYLSTANDGFFLQNPYTLNKVSPNDRAFLQGDFSQGGWDAWLSAITSPSNNPFGAQLSQQNALSGVVDNAANNAREEARWGNGIMSYRGSNCGNNSAGQPADLLAGTPYDSATSTAASGSSGKPVSLSNTVDCLFNSIKTPGVAIAGSLNKALGTGADSLVSADEINEIVGALFGQLVSNVLGSGGLSGVSQAQAGGGRSYIDQATDPSQITNAQSAASRTSISANYLTTIQNQENQIVTYKTNWQTISDAATSAKNALASATCPAAQNTLTTRVTPVITQATTALGNATSAITSLDSIKAQLISSASTGTSADQMTAVSTASTAYQALLGSPTMPSISDIQYAQAQSIDTSADASTPASLYTQMKQIAASPCS